MKRFQQSHVDHYRDHGFVIVENFLTPEELEGARADLTDTLPGWIEYCDDPGLPKPHWPGSHTTRQPEGISAQKNRPKGLFLPLPCQPLGPGRKGSECTATAAC